MVDFDKEGFLKDLADWDEEVAETIAADMEIHLTQAHWEIITLIRKFYRRYQLSPATRALTSYVKRELGPDKGKSTYLMRLFGGSAAKTVAKIAGLPKPDNCL